MASTAAETSDEAAPSAAWNRKRRYVIAIGLLVIVTLGYMDRVNFSVAGPNIIDEFGLSVGEFGVVTSLFNWAYVLCLIPVGMMADRWGAKVILPVGIVVWSLGAGLTGAATGLAVLVAARLILGAGESTAYPVGNLVVREWAPSKERGVFTGMLNAGALVGPAVGAVVAGYLIVGIGWRESFFILGGAGALIGLGWGLIYNSPEKAKWLSDEERDMILHQREASSEKAQESSSTRMSVRRLLRTKTVWGLMLTQGCAVYTSYLFLSFLPLFLVTQRGLDILGSGLVTGLTYGVAAVGSVIVAFVSDRRLKSSEVQSGGRRKAVVATLLAGLPLLALPWVTDTVLVIALVSWVLIMITAAITLNFALAGDLTRDRSSAGVVFALVTVGGNVFGLLAPIVTGYLVDWTGSYTAPFLIAGSLLFVGAVASWTMCTHVLQPKIAV